MAMIPPPVRPTLQAIVDQAIVATRAASAWLLVCHGDDLLVAAVGGLARATTTPGAVAASTPNHSYTLCSGQPAAVVPQSDDRSCLGAAGHPGLPASILTAPCGHGVPLGLLELADKAEALPFSFQDVTVVSHLAAVAAAALTETPAAGDLPVAGPETLAVSLRDLAITDPGRYRRTARLLAAVLDPG